MISDHVRTITSITSSCLLCNCSHHYVFVCIHFKICHNRAPDLCGHRTILTLQSSDCLSFLKQTVRSLCVGKRFHLTMLGSALMQVNGVGNTYCVFRCSCSLQLESLCSKCLGLLLALLCSNLTIHTYICMHNKHSF